MAADERVEITLDGKKFQVPAGRMSFRALASLLANGSAVASFTVTTHSPRPPDTVSGNDSFPVRGEEVFRANR